MDAVLSAVDPVGSAERAAGWRVAAVGLAEAESEPKQRMGVYDEGGESVAVACGAAKDGACELGWIGLYQAL